MANNQFVVDLGEVKLSDVQKRSVNAAIQKAVAGELANLEGGNQLALFPVDGKHKIWGPILWGIIARPFNDKWLKDIGQIGIHQ